MNGKKQEEFYDYKDLLLFVTYKLCLRLMVSEPCGQSCSNSACLANDLSLPHLSRPLTPWQCWPAKAASLCQDANLCHLRMSSAMCFMEGLKRERVEQKLPFIAIPFVLSNIRILSERVLNILGMPQPILFKIHAKSRIYFNHLSDF